MVHFPKLEMNLFIEKILCGIFIFYHTWYDFPNLHILPLVVLSFWPTGIFPFVVIIILPNLPDLQHKILFCEKSNWTFFQIQNQSHMICLIRCDTKVTYMQSTYPSHVTRHVWFWIWKKTTEVFTKQREFLGKLLDTCDRLMDFCTYIRKISIFGVPKLLLYKLKSKIASHVSKYLTN